jgi:hypothetical protein
VLLRSIAELADEPYVLAPEDRAREVEENTWCLDVPVTERGRLAVAEVVDADNATAAAPVNYAAVWHRARRRTCPSPAIGYPPTTSHRSSCPASRTSAPSVLGWEQLHPADTDSTPPDRSPPMVWTYELVANA